MAIFPLNSLPKKIKIGWFNSKIDTYFRTWLAILDLQDDLNLSDEERVIIMFKLAFPYTHYIRFFLHSKEYMEAITEFARCGHSVRNGGTKLVDFYQDWDLICAAFKHDYNINLEKDFLHWWEYCRLFSGLNESNAIVKIVSARGMDISKIKDKELKKHYQKMQRDYRIKDKQEKIREQMSDIVFAYQVEKKNQQNG